MRRWLPSLRDVGDLLVLLVAAIVIHPLVPVTSWVARDDDLLPWATLVLVGVAAFRGKPLGMGQHPSLTPRDGGWFARRGTFFSNVLVPIVVLFWYDVFRVQFRAWFKAPWSLLLQPATWELYPDRGPWPQYFNPEAWPELSAAILISIGFLVAAFLARRHEETAWQPAGRPDWLVWLFRALFVGAVIMTLGIFGGILQGISDTPGWGLPKWLTAMPSAGVLGVQFLSVGLINERPQSHRQRLASGRNDGTSYRRPMFRYLLAFFGPSFGLAALYFLNTVLIGPFTFTEGTMIAIYVVAWGGVLWPPRTPVALFCILHEVVPYGGKDPQPEGMAVPFDAPPSGALRISPRRLRRLRSLHPWLVPVHGARLESLDDPIKQLWRPPPPPLPFHILGDAWFEPDPITGKVQIKEITLHMTDQTDVGRVSDSGAAQRRLVILRPFPPMASVLRKALRTYRWEPVLTEDSLQVVDATTQTLSMRSGDLLVLSIEGVARAYEVELGVAVYGMHDLRGHRPPQIEDYVSAG